jgi:hypothetical protein
MIKSAEERQVRLFNRVLESYTCIINGSFFGKLRSLGNHHEIGKGRKQKTKKKHKEETADVCAWVLESNTQASTYV